jgi:adenylate cyclase
MADIILDHNGTIDEFIGDSVLCFFGAPVARPDDALRAVHCAIAMQHGMGRVNETNRREGLPEVEMGIAVHTGEVVVGNIGSVKRAKYGAVGSHVNAAARIESYTVGGQVLISAATLAEAGGDVLVGVEIPIRAKGFSEPIPAFDLRGISGSSPLSLEWFADEMVVCDPPLPVKVTLVEGMHLSDVEKNGLLVEVSERRATLAGDFTFAPYESVRLILLPGEGLGTIGEVYAKVLPGAQRLIGTMSLRLTAVPSEARELIRSRRDRERPG